MQLNHVDTFVQTHGLQAGRTFTIKADASAFKIISDGLYSNKIRAVVREIACNAMDAHTASGQPERPIEVTLPAWDKPNFVVRDHGTGLSDTEISDEQEGLYTTFFASSKRNSNLETGCFGLGCKAPFAYTDQFTVISAYQGTETTWSCYKDEHGCPTAVPVKKRPIDPSWPHGLTVIVPTRDADCSEFTSQALSVFPFFSTLPKLLGANAPKLKRPTARLETDNLLDIIGAPATTADVLTGGVVYPIDAGAITSKLPDTGAGKDKLLIALSQGGVWKAPLGSIDMTPSRESLQYTPRTLTTLRELATKVAQDRADYFKRAVLDRPLTWELLTSDHGFRQSNFHPSYGRNQFANYLIAANVPHADHLRLRELLFDGELNVNLDDLGIHRRTVFTLRRSSGGRRRVSRTDHPLVSYSLSIGAQRPTIVDMRKGTYMGPRCREYLYSDDCKQDTLIALPAAYAKDDPAGYQADLDKLAAALLDATVLTDATLPGRVVKEKLDLEDDDDTVVRTPRKRGVWRFPITSLVTNFKEGTEENLTFQDIDRTTHPWYLPVNFGNGDNPTTQLARGTLTLYTNALHDALLALSQYDFPNPPVWRNYFCVQPSIPLKHNLDALGYRNLGDIVDWAIFGELVAPPEQLLKHAFYTNPLCFKSWNDPFDASLHLTRQLLEHVYHDTPTWQLFKTLPNNPKFAGQLALAATRLRDNHTADSKWDPWALALLRWLFRGKWGNGWHHLTGPRPGWMKDENRVPPYTRLAPIELLLDGASLFRTLYKDTRPEPLSHYLAGISFAYSP